jgi:hypothetical protein
MLSNKHFFRSPRIEPLCKGTSGLLPKAINPTQNSKFEHRICTNCESGGDGETKRWGLLIRSREVRFNTINNVLCCFSRHADLAVAS